MYSTADARQQQQTRRQTPLTYTTPYHPIPPTTPQYYSCIAAPVHLRRTLYAATALAVSVTREQAKARGTRRSTAPQVRRHGRGDIRYEGRPAAIHPHASRQPAGEPGRVRTSVRRPLT